MGQPHDEDDKATVVIDINALKKQKEQKQQEIDGLAEALEFQAAGPGDEAASTPELPVAFFDFGTGIFQALKGKLPASIPAKFVKELPELNGLLKLRRPQVVVFPYEANPKAVNQLCAQLKLKFPEVKVFITAKNLAPDKIKIHSASPAGAQAYLKWPFSEEEFKAALNGIVKKSA